MSEIIKNKWDVYDTFACDQGTCKGSILLGRVEADNIKEAVKVAKDKFNLPNTLYLHFTLITK